MRAFRTGGREAVVALLAATALLAPAAAVGGYVAGQDIGQSRRPAPLASPSSTPSVPPSVSPSSAMPSVSPTPSQRAGALSDEARALAARATVRLSPLSGSYSGSGSIVSADGLVLTNAHVAQRTAPGLATLYGTETYNEEDPEQLVVSTTEGDGPAAAALRTSLPLTATSTWPSCASSQLSTAGHSRPGPAFPRSLSAVSTRCRRVMT